MPSYWQKFSVSIGRASLKEVTFTFLEWFNQNQSTYFWLGTLKWIQFWETIQDIDITVSNKFAPIVPHLNVLEPVSWLQVGEPMGVLDVGVHHILQLAQRLPHHVDVVNVQEHQLSILICVFTFVTAPLHLSSLKIRGRKRLEAQRMLGYF